MSYNIKLTTLVASSLLLVACGGDSNSEPESTTKPDTTVNVISADIDDSDSGTDYTNKSIDNNITDQTIDIYDSDTGRENKTTTPVVVVGNDIDDSDNAN